MYSRRVSGIGGVSAVGIESRSLKVPPTTLALDFDLSGIVGGSGST